MLQWFPNWKKHERILEEGFEGIGFFKCQIQLITQFFYVYLTIYSVIIHKEW